MRRLSNFRPFGAVLVAILLSAFAAQLDAQTSSPATVTFRVVDATNAVIPGAHIQIAPAPKDLPTELATNRDGELTLNLQPGIYDIQVSSSGFQSLKQSIHVEGSQKTLVRIRLHIGFAASGPVVTAQPSPLKPTTILLHELIQN